MTRKERFDDMEKALRANCPCEYVLDEIPFDFYAVNMVYHGWGNIEQALTEFAEKIKEMLAEYVDTQGWLDETTGDGLMSVWQFRDWVLKDSCKIDQTLQEFLNSLNNKNQGE